MLFSSQRKTLIILAVFCVVVAGVLTQIMEAQAATYYVDCDVASSGDGSSWEQAFKTIAEGENAATQSGDIVEISGGTYNETVVAAYPGVTFKGSTESGHDGEVIINAATNGLYTTQDDITLQNVTIIGGDANYRGAVRATGDNFIASNIIVHDYVGKPFWFDAGAINFSVKNSHIYGNNYGSYAAAGSTGVFQYSIFRGNGVDIGDELFLATGTGTSVDISNCLFVGSRRRLIRSGDNASITIRNSFIGGNGRTYSSSAGYSIYGSAVDVDYSIVNGHGLNPHNYNIESGVTIGSHVIQNVSPYFNGWAINEGIFTITVDDREHLDNANNISQVLDDYGLHLTYFLHIPQSVTSSEWNTIKDMWDRGHDIGSHTRHHPHLTQDGAISLTYSGTDTNVIATVSNNGTQFQITTTEGNDDVGPLDLTSASYDTLGEISNYLNGLSNYSSSLVDESGWPSHVLSTSLADGDTDLSDKAAHDVNYDKRMPSAGGRYFTEELVNSKSDIETGIGNGYMVKSLGYPGHDHDSTVMNAVKDAGYEVARGGTSYDNPAHYEGDYLLQNIENIYQAPITISTTNIKGPNYDTLTDTEKEARIRGFATAYATFALENGVWASVTIHGADTFNTTEVGWLVDELVDCGITIYSMREAIEYIKENWETPDGENKNVTFTRTYSDSHDYTLQYTSSLIDAGTDISLTTDFAGNPIYGTPDCGPYEYQPPYTMGTDRVSTSTAIRVYGDEKFRNKETPSDGNTANLSVTIPGSDTTQWLDVTINTWENSGNRNKNWTESTTVSDLTNIIHIVGDLEADKYYNVKVDDSIDNLTGTNCNTVGSDFVCHSNSEGKITFTYTGTYSDHTFEVEEGDNTPPVLTEVTPVSSPTNDPTPDYTFNTTEAGTITYGGDCSSSTTSAVSGDNTITFNALSEGNHSNCTIIVTDAVGNASAALSVTGFTIDTTVSVRSSGSPSGTLAWNTTSATLSLTTDENATCKYGVSFGTAYDSIANTFSTTGGTTHSASITGLSSNNSYTYYVRCQDSAGNINIDDYTISFSIAAGGGGGLPHGAHNPPTPPAPTPENPEGGFRVLINEGAESTNSRTVTLKLFAGSDTKRMAISRDPDFSPGADTGQIPFQNSYTWDLCYGQKKCPSGVYTVYVKFYTQWGRSSEVVSDSIILRGTEPQVSVEEMTVEEIKTKITEIQKKIIILLEQLIQLIQERIMQLQARLP